MTPNSDRQERLHRWKQIADSHAKPAAMYAPTRSGPLVEGDLLAFSEQDVPGIWWAVLKRHPEDEDLWEIVPADTVDMVGTADVSVLSAFGRLSLRCGLSVWLHQEDVEADSRAGALDAWDLSRAQDKLADVLNGEAEGGLAADEADADPELAEWIEELMRSRGRLQASLHAPRALQL